MSLHLLRLTVALLLVLGLGGAGCVSAERRDLIKYFEAMAPHQSRLGELTGQFAGVSSLPYPQRLQAYQELVESARTLDEEVARVRPPEAASAYHALFHGLLTDFQAYSQAAAARVDRKLSLEKRTEARAAFEKLAASWPEKLEALKAEQRRLGEAYGISFE